MSKLVVNTKSLEESIQRNPNFMPTLIQSLQAGANAVQTTSDPELSLPADPSNLHTSSDASLSDNYVSDQPSDYMNRIVEERMQSMIDNSMEH